MKGSRLRIVIVNKTQRTGEESERNFSGDGAAIYRGVEVRGATRDEKKGGGEKQAFTIPAH